MLRMTALAAAFLPLATFTNAQTVNIFTTGAGSITNSIGSAVASVVGKDTGLRMLVTPLQSLAYDQIEGHEGEFALGLYLGAYYDGMKPFSDTKLENLRNVGALVPLRAAMYVRADSDIHTFADLKGKRIYCEYAALPTADVVIDIYLDAEGLTRDDVECLSTQNVGTGVDGFTSNKVDAFHFGVGAAKVKEAAAAVGGLRALPFTVSEEQAAHLDEKLPGSYVYIEKPSEASDGVTDPTPLLAYDVTLFTQDQVDDDIVYQVTKAVYENKEDMISVFGGFGLFDPNSMAKPQGDLPFHPGAIRYYKEIGIGDFK